PVTTDSQRVSIVGPLVIAVVVTSLPGLQRAQPGDDIGHHAPEDFVLLGLIAPLSRPIQDELVDPKRTKSPDHVLEVLDGLLGREPRETDQRVTNGLRGSAEIRAEIVETSASFACHLEEPRFGLDVVASPRTDLGWSRPLGTRSSDPGRSRLHSGDPGRARQRTPGTWHPVRRAARALPRLRPVRPKGHRHRAQSPPARARG